ncbi:DUF4055 domain-containing protein [Roseinatronobacter alkalisoli]|uniref:DUF4055 domain-containing protein n=1 Tax=Roseinatronobacter alkalisoli TaxID=3028235 RepID=A0ABT5TE94_9RHOB|nr:DUF4055 domain-containing protein [Roseinatronobacter sp. HJB301]MDD7973436.1 DUF4055 domain-containing protein [Roseinatronobacter sp. HJB301]
MDITQKHPLYEEYEDSWKLMRDAMDGEDKVKAGGTTYLPMKPGLASLTRQDLADKAYRAYKDRAEFPEVLSPVVRGILGILTEKPPVVELPTVLDDLKEACTLDGLTFDSLYRKVLREVLITGRHAILPSLDQTGGGYLACYTAEAIVSWDTDEDSKLLEFTVLDESSMRRNKDSNEWELQLAFLELGLDDAGNYQARKWSAPEGSDVPVPGEWEAARKAGGAGLQEVPMVFVGTDGLSPDPDDIPLYGLAKLALRYYRLDADFMHALHMTSEPTPVAIGVTKEMIENDTAPKTLGSAVMWYLPEGGSAMYLEFSGPGLAKQQETLADTMERAKEFGAKLIAGSSDQSGEALALLLGSQTAPLKSIAVNVAAGVEKALRKLAEWKGANPDDVLVTPHLDFYTKKMTAAEITALVDGWVKEAYSWKTLFARLQAGGVIPEGVTEEQEAKRLLENRNEGDGLT